MLASTGTHLATPRTPTPPHHAHGPTAGGSAQRPCSPSSGAGRVGIALAPETAGAGVCRAPGGLGRVLLAGVGAAGPFAALWAFRVAFVVALAARRGAGRGGSTGLAFEVLFVVAFAARAPAAAGRTRAAAVVGELAVSFWWQPSPAPKGRRGGRRSAPRPASAARRAACGRPRPPRTRAAESLGARRPGTPQPRAQCPCPRVHSRLRSAQGRPLCSTAKAHALSAFMQAVRCYRITRAGLTRVCQAAVALAAKAGAARLDAGRTAREAVANLRAVGWVGKQVGGRGARAGAPRRRAAALHMQWGAARQSCSACPRSQRARAARAPRVGCSSAPRAPHRFVVGARPHGALLEARQRELHRLAAGARQVLAQHIHLQHAWGAVGAGGGAAGRQCGMPA